MLDTDVFVLRNIDHLVQQPVPAFVFGYKCFPRRELRTALMVVEPRQASWRHAKQAHTPDAWAMPGCISLGNLSSGGVRYSLLCSQVDVFRQQAADACACPTRTPSGRIPAPALTHIGS